MIEPVGYAVFRAWFLFQRWIEWIRRDFRARFQRLGKRWESTHLGKQQTEAKRKTLVYFVNMAISHLFTMDSLDNRLERSFSRGRCVSVGDSREEKKERSLLKSTKMHVNQQL